MRKLRGGDGKEKCKREVKIMKKMRDDKAHGGHIENEPTGLIDNLINQWLTGLFDGLFQNLLSMCPQLTPWVN